MNKFFLSLLIFFCLPNVVGAQVTHSCEPLKNIFQTEAKEQNGLCSVEIVRKDIEATHMGHKLKPETMGLAFHFNFEKVDDGTAVIGEMALLQEEVNDVVDILRKGNIDVSAIHNHMIYEEPRIMYLHLQQVGDLNQMAKTIKNAVDTTTNE
jgi:hypothetical protein